MADSDKLNQLMARAAEQAKSAEPADPTVDDVLDNVLDTPEVPQAPVPAEPVQNTQPTPASTDAVAPVAEAPAPAPSAPKTVEFPTVAAASVVHIDENLVVGDLGSLAIHAALKAALEGGEESSPVFKVAALQSGYCAEFRPLAFEDINRIQASSVDAHAARIKLLKVLHSKITEFSCGAIRFQDWLKQTANGDYDTLMYGLYAATYPGVNEFDTNCQHCGAKNKVAVDVNQLVRIESDDVFGEIRKLLDPKTDYKGAIQNSMVGRAVQRRLPLSNIVVEIRNPSIQDYLDGVQWFVAAQDKQTGALPVDQAGADVIRTLNMYVSKLLVPVPGTQQYAEISSAAERANVIGRLKRIDGEALVKAVDEETNRLQVSYSLPAYNCASCQKRNEDLYLDFEALLFIKLREKA